MQVPPTVIQSIYKRRRAFLWAGDNQISSAKCLVAWQSVCTPKDLSGLGTKDFRTQNICLLLKLVHRLHCVDALAWAQWVRQYTNLANQEIWVVTIGVGAQWDQSSHCIRRSLQSLFERGKQLCSGMMSGMVMKLLSTIFSFWTNTLDSYEID